MTIDYIDACEYWTAESLNELRSWEILHSEPWTEAVSRLHCRNLNASPPEFRMIYCRNSILEQVIQVETVQ